MDQPGVGNCYIVIGDKHIAVHLPLPVAAIGAGPGEVLSRSVRLVTQDAILLGLGTAETGRVLRNTVDLDLIRSWIDGCDEHHEMICAIRHEGSQDLPDDLRVIDVRRKCITLAKPNCRYIALSYVWGRIQMLSLGKDNCTQLQKEGALLQEAKIPNVVRNAMELVSDLGERYLWVDALCILQDDPEQKHEQISRMDAVYHNSYLTLIARSSKDATGGLPGVGRTPRAMSQRIFHLQGLRFVDTLSTLPSYWDEYVWDNRAWTYQEELLSRRKLYFTDERAHFECQKWNVSEDIDRTKLPGSALFTQLQRPNSNKPGYLSPMDPESPLFQKYAYHVTTYTQRQLSYPSDILNAFGGIAAVWKNVIGWELIEGMPIPALEYALHWYSAQLCRRRTWSTADAGMPRQVPSWSWAGWVGQVFHNNLTPNNTRLEMALLRLSPESQLTGGKESVSTVEIRSAVASFKISNREVFLDVTVRSPLVNVSLGIHDSFGRRCGITRSLLLPLSEEKDPGRSAYECVLLSRSWSFPTRNTYHTQAQWVTLTAHEDACSYLGRLRADMQWPSLGTDSEFDLEFFPDGHWNALNVLILKKNGDEYERVGIGIIHEDAWKAALPEERTIYIL